MAKSKTPIGNDPAAEHGPLPWQPVRIAPAPKTSPCGGDPRDEKHFLSKWREHQGKVVRVRPFPIERVLFPDRLDRKAYQVHPDDLEMIEFDSTDVLCEHQIQAD